MRNGFDLPLDLAVVGTPVVTKGVVMFEILQCELIGW
jgi:hypothetical protein